MLFRKLIRTAGRYRGQFISMIIMTALGIGMFLGFNMEWVSLEQNMFRFLENSGFADYRVYSEEGFSVGDLEKVLAGDGVEDASRYLAVNAELAGTGRLLSVTVTENPQVSGFVLMEGEPYEEDSEDGLWLFDKFADRNQITIGDTLELNYESLSITGTVKGLVESGEYMIPVQDETQLMPSFETYGYVYLSPAALRKAMEEAVKDEIRAQARKSMGKRYTEEYGDLLVERTFQTTMDKAWNQIFPAIHVRSSMEKKEFKERMKELFGKTLVIVTKDETISYSEAEGEANEGKTMGTILPVLFLLISVLTMITTMHRIASNEKTQIGTLKALGFRDRKILRHYSAYPLLIGLAGTLLGIILGYLVAAVIMNPNGMMGTYIVMPEWKLFIPWWCWLIMLLVIALMVLIGRLSVRKMMEGTAADALRPYVPKASRPMLIERTRMWERRKFGTKWNLRDIMRHKSRSLVTLIGVLGCMILMVSAFGMYETANAFIQTTYVENAQYESKLFLSDTVTKEEAASLAEEYEGDFSASLSVQMEEDTYALDIYHIGYGLVRFMDQNNRPLELPADGALVCLRIQEKYNLSIGDTLKVSLFGTDKEYTIRVAGFNRSMSESISLSDTYAAQLFFEGEALTESDAYRIQNVYTQAERAQLGEDVRISSVQSKGDIVDSMMSFMDILYTSVMILVLAATVLGVVVLYNLGVMSYVERYREMATLKVVGFRNRKIQGLLIGQNLWLTVLGVVLGLFAGIGVINYIMKALAPEYEMKVVIGPLTVAASIVLTFAVSLLVGLSVARKSRKVDMVEALKTPE